ncbi:MAG: hypothetical protein IJW34_00400 [Clostridia bacterium]|nr:hypothetical protein [Clostridia bacterium]
MDDSFNEKLKAVLADPEALAKITSIAASLGGGGEEAPSLPASTPQPAFSPRQTAKDPRLDLLFALRPLVGEDKKKRIDDLMQIATVASLLGSFGNRGERS